MIQQVCSLLESFVPCVHAFWPLCGTKKRRDMKYNATIFYVLVTADDLSSSAV